MTIAEMVPGMKPGSTGRNVILGLIYGIVALFAGPFIIPVLILASPLIAAIAVGKNYKGTAEKLSGLPGIDPEAGLQSAVVAFVCVVLLLAVVSAIVPADDTEQASDSASSSTPTPEQTDAAQAATETETQEQTESPTETQVTETPEPEPEPDTETPAPETEAPESSGDGYQVRISYDGEWSGAIGKEGTTRSVDGSGTETFDIEGDPFIVSGNAQKQDAGSGELTIQILEDGEVISEQSTTAEYGVASTSSQT